MVGSFMAVLDTSIVNVAIPRCRTSSGPRPTRSSGIATGYTLALGIVTPLTGWLGDKYGSTACRTRPSSSSWSVRRSAGSPAASTSSSPPHLPGRRGWSAAGRLAGDGLPDGAPREAGVGDGSVRLRLVVARRDRSHHRRLPGPVRQLGLIFYINVPIGGGGVIALDLPPTRFPRTAGQRFDVAGFVTIAVGLFALLLALSEGETWHWTSYPPSSSSPSGSSAGALRRRRALRRAADARPQRVPLRRLHHLAILVTILSIGLFSGLF